MSWKANAIAERRQRRSTPRSRRARAPSAMKRGVRGEAQRHERRAADAGSQAEELCAAAEAAGDRTRTSRRERSRRRSCGPRTARCRSSGLEAHRPRLEAHEPPPHDGGASRQEHREAAAATGAVLAAEESAARARETLGGVEAEPAPRRPSSRRRERSARRGARPGSPGPSSLTSSVRRRSCGSSAMRSATREAPLEPFPSHAFAIATSTMRAEAVVAAAHRDAQRLRRAGRSPRTVIATWGKRATPRPRPPARARNASTGRAPSEDGGTSRPSARICSLSARARGARPRARRARSAEASPGSSLRASSTSAFGALDRRAQRLAPSRRRSACARARSPESVSTSSARAASTCAQIAERWLSSAARCPLSSAVSDAADEAPEEPERSDRREDRDVGGVRVQRTADAHARAVRDLRVGMAPGAADRRDVEPDREQRQRGEHVGAGRVRARDRRREDELEEERDREDADAARGGETGCRFSYS